MVDLLFDPYLSVNRAKELSTMAKSRNRPQQGIVAGGPRAGCKRVQWFTALGLRYGIKKQAELYKRMLRAAMVSKLFNAPSLVPNIIYDGDPDEFTAWWEAQGGRVHYHNLTFYNKIHEAYANDGRLEKQWLTQYGAYMRMDLPVLLQGSQPPTDVDHRVRTSPGPGFDGSWAKRSTVEEWQSSPASSTSTRAVTHTT